VGILIGLALLKWGILRPSFVDAASRSPAAPPPPHPKRKRKGKKADKPVRVAFTAEDGVNPRLEILRECLFLAPAVALAVAAWALLHGATAAGQWWADWFNADLHPMLAPRLSAAGGSLFGFLIGGAVVWATRIFGTLGFGKEAMGLGDVHILAGVGAVAGWAVSSVAFFVAPVAGLLVVLYLFLVRRQRELPYGPWLAFGTVLVMLFYDGIIGYIAPGLVALFGSR
jgi:leader peptidase (prepilin peptidase)/N-methyltransferase